MSEIHERLVYDPAMYRAHERPREPVHFRCQADYDEFTNALRLSMRESFPCPHCGKGVVAGKSESVTPLALQAMRGGDEVGLLLAQAVRAERDSAAAALRARAARDQMQKDLGEAQATVDRYAAFFEKRGDTRDRRSKAFRRARRDWHGGGHA